MGDLSTPLFVARPRIEVSFHRKGPWLLGVAHLQGPGAPIVLTARVNVRDIEKAMRQAAVRHSVHAASGSLFGGIGKAARGVAHAASRVAHQKVARELYGQVRKTMKNPITSAALSATAIAFPPVGIPTAAAFVAANKVLDGVESGGAAAQRAKTQIRTLARRAQLPGAAGEKARKVAQVLSITHQWRQGLKVAEAHGLPALQKLAPPRRVRGQVTLPSGAKLEVEGTVHGGRIMAVVLLPDGRRVPLRASVQGACGC